VWVSPEELDISRIPGRDIMAATKDGSLSLLIPFESM